MSSSSHVGYTSIVCICRIIIHFRMKGIRIHLGICGIHIHLLQGAVLVRYRLFHCIFIVFALYLFHRCCIVSCQFRVVNQYIDNARQFAMLLI